MSNHWFFKNGFSSKLINNTHFFLDKIKYKKYESFDQRGKLLYSNIEIIQKKSSRIQTNIMKSYLEIIENDWKYPFPNNYIPCFYGILKLNMNINYCGNMYNIKEIMKINIHKPSPYGVLCNYKLKLNDNYIESRKITGPMDYSTFNSSLITNQKAKELLTFIQDNLYK